MSMGVVEVKRIRRRPCGVPLKRGHHLGGATYLLCTTSDEMVLSAYHITTTGLDPLELVYKTQTLSPMLRTNSTKRFAFTNSRHL